MRRGLIRMTACFGFCLWLAACVPPEEPEPQSIDYTLDDPLCRKIIDFQDRQQADSLFPFLRHKDPTYRWLAARAFASYRTKQAVDSLIPLLTDSWTEIRAQAAFSLGQIGSSEAERALIGAFEQNDSLGQYDLSNAAILEAVGKCGGEHALKHLSSIQTYLPSDTLLLLGQARGLYQYMLRGMKDSASEERMIRWLTRSIYPRSVRAVAGDYLKRCKDPQLADDLFFLRKTYQKKGPQYIRSTLAYLLGTSGKLSVLPVYEQRWKEDPPVNERHNIISGCFFLPYESVFGFVRNALDDPNLSVSSEAARFFLERGLEDDASEYREWALDSSLDTEVRLTLYRAALRHLPFYYALTKASIRGVLHSFLEQSGNPYIKVRALMALSEEWDFRRDILEAAYAEAPPAVKTGAVRAFANVLEQEEGMSPARRRIWLSEMQELMFADDPGMSFEASRSIRENLEKLPVERLDTEKIKKRRQRCALPKNIETYNELGRLVSAMEGRPYTAREPEYSHPINWGFIRSCTDSTFASIRTGRGRVDVRLLPREAPGSVANFIGLVRDGFYDGKVVHRVVPDFVIQDGCPRGDGFGNLDYTIRSETPPVYYNRPGRFGMASAGPHTECTQWFVTHRPTPHLDGRYTIFGQVISGLEHVYEIRVGDTIQSIRLIHMEKQKKE